MLVLAVIVVVQSIGIMNDLMLARAPNKSKSILPIQRMDILKHRKRMMLFTMRIVMRNILWNKIIIWLTKTLTRTSRVFVSPSSARLSLPFMLTQACLNRGDRQGWGDQKIQLNLLLWDLVIILAWLRLLGTDVKNVLIGSRQ